MHITVTYSAALWLVHEIEDTCKTSIDEMRNYETQ